MDRKYPHAATEWGWQFVFAAARICRDVQELLGHADVTTTMTYLHVLNRGGLGVRSPVDRLIGGGPAAPEGKGTKRQDSED